MTKKAWKIVQHPKMNDTKNIHPCSIYKHIWRPTRCKYKQQWYGHLWETWSNLNATAHKAYGWKKFSFRYWACKLIITLRIECYLDIELVNL